MNLNKKTRHIVLLLISGTLLSCNYFKSPESDDYLARVKNSYLTKAEVQKALPDDISPEDSLAFVQNYIDRWATKHLLVEGAKRNLPEQKQKQFNKMVEQYRQELYTEAYKDIIIAKELDTVITKAEIEAYFKKHKENFKLNEDLVKLRYIKLAKNAPEEKEIMEKFKRFDADDQIDLKETAYKYEAISLNDSVWVRTKKLYEKIPPLKVEKKDDFLKKGKFITRRDSLSLYLVFLKDVRLHNEQAPLSYAEPSLRQIILNKRKLKIEKQLEKDITEDALEDDTYEIYN